MRVLHVIKNLNPAGGGPQVIAINLAAAQVNLASKVTLAVEPDRAADEWLVHRRLAVPGLCRVDITPISIRGASTAVLLGRGRSTELEKLIAEHDFVHLHSIWDPPVRVASDIARRQKVPYAILVNGMLDPWSLAQRKWKKRLALACGYRAMFNGAAFLHLGNTDEQTLIRPLGLRTSTEIIPNGIRPEEFASLPPAGSFRARFPQLGGRPIVLFLSRLHFKKGLDYLAGAFAILAKNNPEVMLVVAGPDGGAEAPFREQIQAAGLTDRVVLTGALYGAAKLEALVDATVFCLPSRQEGFSVAILESLAVGTPVVISENCHFPEVVEAGAGQVVPLDVTQIAKALGRVISEKEEHDRQALAAAALVRKHYTWQRIAAMSLDLYRRYCNK